jgi:hypothetical protein
MFVAPGGMDKLFVSLVDSVVNSIYHCLHMQLEELLDQETWWLLYLYITLCILIR